VASQLINDQCYWCGQGTLVWGMGMERAACCTAHRRLASAGVGVITRHEHARGSGAEGEGHTCVMVGAQGKGGGG
jgi:hypothetical protein